MRFGYISCVMTIDDLIERSGYELFTKEVIPFTMCSHRIVQVICVCMIILFSCLIIILICTKSRSLFDLCMNILNRIVGYIGTELYCSCVFLLLLCFPCFHCYCIDVFMMCVLSHLNKDYLLTYNNTMP